jgi:hypothetical protein
MFEPISTITPKQSERVSNLLATPLYNLDVEILKAYERITMNYKSMLRNHISKSKQGYVEWQWPWQIHKQSLIKEFVCKFCSIKLVLLDGQYRIILWIGSDSLQNGTGVTSNGLLRVAFKHTMQEHTNLMIEQCLEIVWREKPLAYYEQKADEYEEQSAIWFAKTVPTKL